MRLDARQPMTAAELVGRTPEPELARIIHEYGEEPAARRIARRLVQVRARTPISTTRQLADLVASAIPPHRRSHRIHPATRTFQAIRIAVNDELGSLEAALPKGADGGSSFRDLDRKKRIGVQAGSLAQMILGQRGQQTTPFGFEDEMLEALAAGTIDGAAATPAAIAYFNLRHPDQSLRLVHAYEQEPELSWNVAVGMRGSDAALRQKIDDVIERMLANGSIRDIYARYGVEHRPPSTSR